MPEGGLVFDLKRNEKCGKSLPIRRSRAIEATFKGVDIEAVLLSELLLSEIGLVEAVNELSPLCIAKSCHETSSSWRLNWPLRHSKTK